MTKRKKKEIKRKIKKRVLNILAFVFVILSVSFILNSNSFNYIKGTIIGENNVDRLGEYKEAFSEGINQNMNYQYLELINPELFTEFILRGFIVNNSTQLRSDVFFMVSFLFF